MPATITDIAREVGVSFQVVSKVLNGGRSGSQASEQTRQRIQDAAERLGYRVNTAARAMSTGRFHSVGLVMSNEYSFSSLVSGHLQAMYESLERRNLHLSVHVLPDERLVRDDVLPKLLREHMVDGLLLNYTHRRPEALDDLIDIHGLPAVRLNSNQPTDCAYPDDYAAGRKATEYLLKLGHQRVGYVDFTWGTKERATHYSSEDRRNGYIAAMRDAGFRADVLEHEKLIYGNEALALARQWLARPNRPTAVVSYCYAHAVTVQFAAMTDGLRMPRDLSIVSFGDARPHQAGGPVITSWLIPVREVVCAGVALLIKRMKRRQSEPSIAVPFALEEGESCAALLVGS